MATKRKAVDLSTKYQALMDLEKGFMKIKQVVEKYNVPRTTILAWVKTKETIFQQFEAGGFGGKAKKMRSSLYPDVEEAVTQWFTLARQQGWAISDVRALP